VPSCWYISYVRSLYIEAVVEVVEVEEEEKGKEMRASQVEVGGNINLPPPRPRKTNRNLWETATLP
jgi:hypothetical protein